MKTLLKNSGTVYSLAGKQMFNLRKKGGLAEQIRLFFEGKVGERKPSRSPSNPDDVALVKAYRKDLEATEGVVAEARTQALADREAAVKPQSIRDYKLVLKPGSEVTTTLVKDQPFCILM